MIAGDLEQCQKYGVRPQYYPSIKKERTKESQQVIVPLASQVVLEN